MMFALGFLSGAAWIVCGWAARELLARRLYEYRGEPTMERWDRNASWAMSLLLAPIDLIGTLLALRIDREPHEDFRSRRNPGLHQEEK